MSSRRSVGKLGLWLIALWLGFHLLSLGISPTLSWITSAFAQEDGEDQGDGQDEGSGQGSSGESEEAKTQGKIKKIAPKLPAATENKISKINGGQTPAEPEVADEGQETPESGKGPVIKRTPGEPGEAAVAGQEEECPPGKVRLDLSDMELSELVKMMSKMTMQNFLLDKTIEGTKISIISQTCVTPTEAYDIFMSVLYVNGMTTVKVGQLNKIIQRQDAPSQPIDTVTEGFGRENEKYITQLIPLQNIDAVEISTAFRPLISPDGNIFAYGPSNMLIIMDSSANIHRLFRILQKLDVEGSEQMIEVVAIEYASAEIVADVIMQLFEDELSAASSSLAGASGASSASSRAAQLRQRLAQRRAATSRTPATPGRAGALGSSMTGVTQSISSTEQLRIIPDTRTNSLVIKANKYVLKRVRAVIAQLDQPLPGGEGKIHVVRCENADATELASVLADLAGTGGGTGGYGASSRSSRTRSTRQSASGRTTRAGSIAEQYGSRYGSMSGMGSDFGSSQFGTSGGISRDTGNPTHGIAQTSGRFLADFAGAVRITSDPSTNSLVIIASNRDFQIIQDVIAKLDIPRPQVYVEVLIAEITADRGLEVGFEFRSTNDVSEEGVQVIGGTNYGGIQTAAVNPLGISGFAVGAADGTITFAGETYSNIGALFQMMQTDRDVNIMATPHILTTDNEDAEIIIADTIPFVTGQITSGTFQNATQTIERKDVGITLRINPSINESDMVRLTLYNESSTVTDSPSGLSASQVGITTAKRSADTVVVVKSRQTVIIGGLMKDNVTYTESKVPVLGDIPLLGYLFKSSKKNVYKTNMLIFITPYIIKDNGDLEEVTRQANFRLQKFRQENRLQRRRDIDEDSMTPPETIFKREDPNAIEIDPAKRGTSVQTQGVTIIKLDEDEGNQEEEQPDAEKQPAEGDTPPEEDSGEDPDFGGGE